MSLYPHEVLPNRTQDQRARQDFFKSFQRHLELKIRSGLPQLYEARVKPKFEKEHGREPQKRKEVRDVMTQDPYYQFWSTSARNTSWGTLLISQMKTSTGSYLVPFLTLAGVAVVAVINVLLIQPPAQDR